MSKFKVGVAGACLFGLPLAATAADLPARMAPPAYVAPVPVFTWTGPYFGINAGYSFNNEGKFSLSNGVGITAANTGIGTSRPGSFKNDADGFTGGAQIGYNYQLGGLGAFGGFGGAGSGIVVGVEADAAYLDGSKTGSYTGFNAGVPAISTFRSDTDFLGTVRGRLGFAFNQFMVFGTGGFAYGDVSQSARLYTTGDPTLLRFSGGHSGFQTGYAYGGGIEYALPTTSFLNFVKSSAVTVKAEYLHYDLGNTSFAANQVNLASAYNVRVRTNGDLARVGLNYKF